MVQFCEWFFPSNLYYFIFKTSFFLQCIIFHFQLLYLCIVNNTAPEIQRSLGLPYIFSSFCFLFCLCLYSNFRLIREITNKISINTNNCINDKSKYLAPVTIKSVEIVPFTTKKIITHNPPFFQFIFIFPFLRFNS